jgi:hypothetical protein
VCPPRSGETSRLGSIDPVAERDQVRATWWQEKQDEVGYSFLVEPQNQGRAGTTWRPSHEWDWHGGCTESAGFAVVHHKTVGVAWLSHKAKTGCSADGDGIWARRETSKRRTRVGIARLASRLSELRSPGIRPMVLRREFPKCPSGACILVLCNRGSFVFQWPPYKLRGERMATISWYPSSFAFLFSLPIFLGFP